MEVMTFAPSEALAPFVRTFTVLEAREETTRVLIPDTAIALGFRYGGAARVLDGDGGEGRVGRSGGGGMILAMFREGGAARFFGEPLHEFFGATVGLDELMVRSEIAR